jgi:hypothetical protein
MGVRRRRRVKLGVRPNGLCSMQYLVVNALRQLV